MTRSVTLPAADHFPVPAGAVEELTEPEDDAALSQSYQAQTVISNQYVVYSSTFQVPTFYFTVHDLHGSPLSLGDILKTSLFRYFALEDTSVTSFAVSRSSSSFPLLSQGDHPTLGTPCWYLHPCETPAAVRELMAEIEAGVNPEEWTEEQLLRILDIWFMVLGSAVDIRSL
ncbi:hypothetical protein HWV62_18170 [Athelia sp. TMB]|nr:hypothetical protein HWV62_18170 [Athelia sp. TMB]